MADFLIVGLLLANLAASAYLIRLERQRRAGFRLELGPPRAAASNPSGPTRVSAER